MAISKNITKRLVRMFAEKPALFMNRNIVFWVDKDKDFLDDIDNLELDGVVILHLTEYNRLKTKLEIENNIHDNHLLIYTNLDAARSDNWLMDVYQYATKFEPSQFGTFLQDFKLSETSQLREFYEEYSKAINNFSSEILELKDYQTVEKLGDSLLMVLYKSQNYLIESIFHYRNFSTTHLKLGELNLDSLLLNRFSRYFDKSFDSIEQIIVFLVDNLATQKNFCTTAIQFVSQLYDKNPGLTHQLINDYGKRIGVYNTYKGKLFESYVTLDYFDFVDEKLFGYFGEEAIDPDINRWKTILAGRNTTKNFEKYRNEYSMIQNYLDFLVLHDSNAFSKYTDINSLINKYDESYYLLDQYYRHYLTKLNSLTEGLSDIIIDSLKKIGNTFDDKYHQYLFDFGQEWTRLFEQDNYSTELVKQTDFYNTFVDNAGIRKAVIISDSLRYEIAKEIADQFNESQRGEATIEGMESFLPSVTKYCMAALLPHKEISVDPQMRVLVDGLQTRGLQQRAHILKKYNEHSNAVNLKDFMNLMTTERKEVLKNQEIVYFYHNQIDAAGEGMNDSLVLGAVNDTIKEILDAIRLLRNLSVGEVILTSDHGFIYTRKPLKEHEKTSKKGNTIETSMRYELTDSSVTEHGFIEKEIISGIFGQFVRGYQRIKTAGGGYQYTHGGYSIQEMLVPVVTFGKLRSEQEQYKPKEKVGVQLINTSNEIKTLNTKFLFLQTHPIDDNWTSRRIRVYIEDEENQPVSNYETLELNSSSENPEERTQNRLLNINSNVDNNKRYYLVIEDADTRTLISKHEQKMNVLHTISLF